MKKAVLIVTLFLAFCLTACSEKKEFDGFGDIMTEGDKVETKKDDGKNTGETTAKKDESRNESGKTDNENASGSGITVTDGTADSNSENTFNIGGINLQVPEGYSRKKVFVGAGLTFESTKMSAMLREYYYDTEKADSLKEYAESMAEEEDEMLPTMYVPDYVIFDAEKYVVGEKCDSCEINIIANYMDEYELIADDMITVAGLKARRQAYKGKTWQDCYREGPVKQFVDATLVTTVIYNDIEKRAVVILSLCKTGKYEEVEKQLNTMFETASLAADSSNMVGLAGASYVELGGFAMEIPESFGQLLDCSYDMYGEIYTNSYGSMSDITRMLGTSAYSMAEMEMQFGGLPMFGGPVGGFEGDMGNAGDFAGFDGNMGDFGEFGGDMGDFGGFGGDMGDFGGPEAGFGGNQGASEEFAEIFKNMDKNWLNLSAMRTVSTISEFEKLLAFCENSIPELFGEILPGVTCTLNEKIEIDGMKGIRFTFTGEIDGEETEFKLLIVNNYKSRFIFIATTATEPGNEQSAAFEELIGSMKNLMK